MSIREPGWGWDGSINTSEVYVNGSNLVRKALALSCLSLIAVGGCLPIIPVRTWEPVLHSVEDIRADPGEQPTKIHLHSGELAVLERWSSNRQDEVLNGSGTLYDVARSPVRSGEFAIPFDSIALVETQLPRVTRPPGLTGLVVWSTLTGAITAVCVADPKACFGSCPTFYVHDGQRERLQAEGFSSSIARVLEARDIDALYHMQPTGQRVVIRMTNEALETHAVRHARLTVARRPPGGRVLATPDGRFYGASELIEPSNCSAAEGDCVDLVRALDDKERSSLADSTDLATRETVQLEFSVPAGKDSLALVIGARHTFVSTFLFYQAIGYFGTNGGEWLAALERGGEAAASAAMGMATELGGIELAVANPGGDWEQFGAYDEAGPIATDVALFPIPDREHIPGQPLRVRLRLAKGSWRLNYVALARLAGEVEPSVLETSAVLRDGFDDPVAKAALHDPEKHLITYPGDEYQLVYDLDASPEDLEFFLDSKGYYYEWMRSEWLSDEDPTMASLVLMDPAKALRLLAPAFKQAEPKMERLFWESRFGR
jgi:hypothetical protein